MANKTISRLKGKVSDELFNTLVNSLVNGRVLHLTVTRELYKEIAHGEEKEVYKIIGNGLRLILNRSQTGVERVLLMFLQMFFEISSKSAELSIRVFHKLINFAHVFSYCYTSS